MVREGDNDGGVEFSKQVPCLLFMSQLLNSEYLYTPLLYFDMVHVPRLKLHNILTFRSVTTKQ